jgi:hypothetical protein
MASEASRGRRAQIVAQSIVAAAGMAALFWAWRADLSWCERHVLHMYWAYDEGQRHVARTWRLTGALIGVITLGLGVPLAGRWAKGRTLRDALAATLRIALSLLLATIASEIGLRVLDLPRRTTRPASVLEVRIGQPDARYGWLYTASRATVVPAGGRPIEYAINGDHNRARTIDEVPDPARPTLLFAGESITAGHALPWEETFPSLVGAALDLQVVNLGVHGYAVDQAYLRLADAVPRFERPVALITLFIPPMLRRLRDEDHPRIAFDETLAPRVVSPQGFWPELRLARVWDRVVPYHDDSEVLHAAEIYRATARIARERGARAIFVAPRFGQPHGDKYLTDELFTNQGLTLVEIDAGSEQVEGHPDTRATRRLADAVIAELRAELARR